MSYRIACELGKIFKKILETDLGIWFNVRQGKFNWKMTHFLKFLKILKGLNIQVYSKRQG